MGKPPDMDQTFRTLIHVAPKLGVEELDGVRNQLTDFLGKEYAQESDNKSRINQVVADNIDYMKFEQGHVVYRLMQIAKERNIQYEPSYENRMALNQYLERKCLPDPMSGEMAGSVAYNPGGGGGGNT